MKKCSKCKKEKPKSDFNNRIDNPSKLLSWCKECYKENNKTKKRREYNSKWLKDSKYFEREFPKKRLRAKQLVQNAVNQGVLEREPCFVCGDEKVEGHHNDYDKPLEVIWLCQKHHREGHRQAIVSKFAPKNVELLTVDNLFMQIDAFTPEFRLYRDGNLSGYKLRELLSQAIHTMLKDKLKGESNG